MKGKIPRTFIEQIFKRLGGGEFDSNFTYDGDDGKSASLFLKKKAIDLLKKHGIEIKTTGPIATSTGNTKASTDTSLYVKALKFLLEKGVTDEWVEKTKLESIRKNSQELFNEAETKANKEYPGIQNLKVSMLPLGIDKSGKKVADMQIVGIYDNRNVVVYTQSIDVTEIKISTQLKIERTLDDYLNDVDGY